MNWNYLTFHLVAETILMLLVVVGVYLVQTALLEPVVELVTSRSVYAAAAERLLREWTARVVPAGLRHKWCITSVLLWWGVSLGSTFLLHLPSMWKRRVQLRRPKEPLDRRWYQELDKPFWNPPDLLFPLMWIPAKLVRGIGTALVWEAVTRKPWATPVLLALSSVVLADLWNQVFFIQHDVAGGLLVISVLLSVELLYTIQLAFTLPGSERFTFPGLIACAFGTTLNFSIWRLNRRKSTGHTS
mmetsp:Transcript_48770/g.119429  ORF Transcript_48770/g.119429 Transcript_48770/m.119429 type:complete len:244 (-) Transcript_48770:1119-1850(-)